jgi:hypothetical protein
VFACPTPNRSTAWRGVSHFVLTFTSKGLLMACMVITDVRYRTLADLTHMQPFFCADDVEGDTKEADGSCAGVS